MRYMIIGGITEANTSNDKLGNICRLLGQKLSELGHTLIICSPFTDSADYWVLQGYIQGNPQNRIPIEFHFIDTYQVRSEIEKLQSKTQTHSFIKIPYPPPVGNNNESFKYAWLLCQLQALESCQVIIAVGGKLNGAANMLLLLAESKLKLVLPFTLLDGAASQSFFRKRYELKDRLGDDYILLQDERRFMEALGLCETMHSNNHISNSEEQSLNFFISYPRKRPCEADYIETILRRRNLKVFRDESDFGAGHAIPTEITEAIHAANVFIAVWSAEYACSPWCFDELELALDRYQFEKMELWILCVDDTRMVPKRARNLVSYKVRTREEIEGTILRLLEHIPSSVQDNQELSFKSLNNGH